MTFGSGGTGAGESSRAVTPSLGQRWDSAELAREALLAFAAGERPAELLERIVAGVLEQDLVRLALEVRAGGPHADRRAIELVSLLAAAGVQQELLEASS